MKYPKIEGFVAATFTPFQADGSLDLAGVEPMADHLLKNGVKAAFIGGTTGESASLSLLERLELANRWMEVTRRTKLLVMVHVGSNCVSDSKALAAQAQTLGAMAISAVAPSYFKPQTIDDLVACAKAIALAAPGLPYYQYDIPMLTGVTHSMAGFLNQAALKIPNLAGVKFSNPDQATLQECLANKDFDILWGIDEALLGAMALGVQGAVGSTYNFVAPVVHQLVSHFAKGDLAAARIEQYKVVRFVRVMCKRGYFGSARVLLDMMGLKSGNPRFPNRTLCPLERNELMTEIQELGFLAMGS